MATKDGVFEPVYLSKINEVSRALSQTFMRELPEVCKSIEMGEQLTNKEYQAILKVARKEIKE